MKENEAIEVLKDFDKQVAAKADGAYQSTIGEMACDTAIKALEEVQQYRTLKKRLSDMFYSPVSLKSIVDELERNLKEPGSPHPMNARILTYKESADYDAYLKAGTPEECRAAVEKQKEEKPTAVLGTFGGTEYECKNCGDDVRYGNKYCRWCGQKLDWSDEE